MSYEPNPIDTSDIRLPPELQALTEELARNTHALWAAKRLADGWVYGPTRNDAEKTNPNLVPYPELAESEKEYDRAIATEVLKAVMAMGYNIRLKDKTKEER